MSSNTTKSPIPAPASDHSAEEWAEASRTVDEIKAATIANTPGLKSSIEAKERSLRRRTNALGRLRTARKLTQQQLAAEDGSFSQGHLSKMESGDPAALTLGTFKRFIEASGGTLKIAAVYDDETYTLDFDSTASETSG